MEPNFKKRLNEIRLVLLKSYVLQLSSYGNCSVFSSLLSFRTLVSLIGNEDEMGKMKGEWDRVRVLEAGPLLRILGGPGWRRWGTQVARGSVRWSGLILSCDK